MAHSTVEYATVWLEAGQCARWKLNFLPGSPGNAVKLRRIFMPTVPVAVAAAGGDEGGEGGDEGGDEGGGDGGGEGGGSGESGSEGSGEGSGEGLLQESEEMLQAEDGEHVGSFTASEGAGMVRAALGLGLGSLSRCARVRVPKSIVGNLRRRPLISCGAGMVPRCVDHHTTQHSARSPMQSTTG